MHKSVLASLLAASVVMAAVPANAALVVLDFNALSGDDLPAISIGAVSFTAPGGTLWTAGYGAAPNGTPGMVGYDLIAGNFRPIYATIAGGTSFVSIDMGDFNADDDSLFLRAYDSSNVLIASDSDFIPASFTGMVTLSVSAAGIARVEYGGIGGAGSSVYTDNFTYDGTVPEPASWALMIAGFGMVGGALRRRVAVAA